MSTPRQALPALSEQCRAAGMERQAQHWFEQSALAELDERQTRGGGAPVDQEGNVIEPGDVVATWERDSDGEWEVNFYEAE
jgi:hypothetical protein